MRGHPTALWFFSASQTFYAFSFGCITSLLILYLTHDLHLSATRAYKIFAAMSALIYVLPLVGGFVGEKLGYLLTIGIGFLTVFIGFIFLSTPDVHCMYIGLSFFAAGNACIIPNTNAIIGLHYAKNSPLRNSAYTFYFIIYNIGFLVSPVVAGFVAIDSSSWSFLIAAISISIGFSIFIYCTKIIEVHDGFSIIPDLKFPFIQRLIFVSLFVCIAVVCAYFLLQKEASNDRFLAGLAAVIVIGLTISGKQQNRSGRLKILAFLTLCILSIAFWALYMLAPSLLTIFISQNINRHILDISIPPSAYYSLDAFFVISLGFVFSWFWNYCAEKKKNISLPVKFSWSLLAIGMGYLVLAAGIFFENTATHLVHSLWIVLAYVFIAIGELCIAPTALAMVGVLMPKGQDGVGMGIWQAFIGFSAVISGYIADLIIVPSQNSPVITNPIYMSAFLRMGLIPILLGIMIILMCIIVTKWAPNIHRHD